MMIRDLQSSDARDVGRLEPKHGAENVNARYKWLQMTSDQDEVRGRRRSSMQLRLARKRLLDSMRNDPKCLHDCI